MKVPRTKSSQGSDSDPRTEIELLEPHIQACDPEQWDRAIGLLAELLVPGLTARVAPDQAKAA